jgi:hypothetical protein
LNRNDIAITPVRRWEMSKLDRFSHADLRESGSTYCWPGVLAAGLLAAATPAHAVVPGADGKTVVYGWYRIYAMNADRTGQTDLTNNPAFDVDLFRSPDGTKIAFSSNRAGEPADVHATNADGTGQTRLTSIADTDFGGLPGRLTARRLYSPDSVGGTPKIYMMNATAPACDFPCV